MRIEIKSIRMFIGPSLQMIKCKNHPCACCCKRKNE